MYDLFIIGGGINGAGIARDASGRGLKVVLVDKGSVGSATSSWSTKLIHGGLRYLENYEFKLVRDSLKEREVIYQIAKDIVRPIPFVIPHSNDNRPAWLIRFGLFIYDYLGGKTSIPKSSTIKIQSIYPEILNNNFSKGFQYYDLQVDDKILTELNIKNAKINGANIMENTKINNVERQKDKWRILLDNGQEIVSKIVINASGPWINEVNKTILNNNLFKKISLVKGSHIILKKIYDYEVAFTLQNKDGRIVFVIPYNNNYTLIGTTEIEVENPNNPTIEKKEIKYLIDCANLYFKNKIDETMIVSTYSGIRPLIENFKSNVSNISRDYIFDIDYNKNMACLINIYGGKLTTYRKLSENLVNKLKFFFPNMKPGWTKNSKLK